MDCPWTVANTTIQAFKRIRPIVAVVVALVYFRTPIGFFFVGGWRPGNVLPKIMTALEFASLAVDRHTKMAAIDSTCNGSDDDCDGLIDEEYITVMCGQGACATTSTCKSGVENCVPLFPQLEGPAGDLTCSDGIDNDCNGALDAMDPSC